MQRLIVGYVQSGGAWQRAVSLDIEADLNTLDDPRKPMLSISVAFRAAPTVSVTSFIAAPGSTPEDSDARLIEEFGVFCKMHRPMIFIGYGICRFDQTILLLKMRQMAEGFRKITPTPKTIGRSGRL